MSKCPELATMAPSRISLEVLGPQHVAVAGDGDEDLAVGRRRSSIGSTRNPSMTASRAAQRVDLGHDDLGAHAPGPAGATPLPQ